MLGKSILGRFVDRYGHAKIFIISEIGMSVCCIVLAFSTTLSIILISSVILGIFTKGTVPVLATMLSRTVEHHASYERAFAINAFFTGIASTLAPTLLGYASQTKGITFAFLLSALCALLATLPAVILNFRKSI
jgi:MFS family permease